MLLFLWGCIWIIFRPVKDQMDFDDLFIRKTSEFFSVTWQLITLYSVTHLSGRQSSAIILNSVVLCWLWNIYYFLLKNVNTIKKNYEKRKYHKQVLNLELSNTEFYKPFRVGVMVTLPLCPIWITYLCKQVEMFYLHYWWLNASGNITFDPCS